MSVQQFRPKITVRAPDFKQAIRHGMELYWDGSTPTKRLDDRGGRTGFTRFVNARVEGKLGEVAFRDWLYEAYGIQAGVDWRIYGDYEQTDHGDLQYLMGRDNQAYKPAVEFDVKKTKPYNSWLAIRERRFRKQADDAPYLLTKLDLSDDLVVDDWEDSGEYPEDDGDLHYRIGEYCEQNLPVDVKLCGAVYPPEFTDEFKSGDRLYDPDSGRSIGPELKEDNRGIAVDDIPSSPERWDQIVDAITGDNPIDYRKLSR